MRLIIAGSRTFNDYGLLKSYCDSFIERHRGVLQVEIVSGCANGADKLGERYADDSGYGITRFPAEWKLYGKQAGYIRNKQMAEYATHCVCFWDGQSKGTKMMIDLASHYQLKTEICT